MDFIFGIIGILIIIAVFVIGIGMIGLGLFTGLLATKRVEKQSKALVDSGQPEMTAEDRKQAVRTMRLIGLACVVLGFVVLIGGGWVFIFPYI